MGENWIIPVAIGAVLLVLVGAALFWMMGVATAPAPPSRVVATHTAGGPVTATAGPSPIAPPAAYLLPNTQPSVITVPTDNGTVVYVDVRKLNAMPGLTQAQKDWIAEHLSRWDNEPAIDVRGVHETSLEERPVVEPPPP